MILQKSQMSEEEGRKLAEELAGAVARKHGVVMKVVLRRKAVVPKT